MVVKHESTLTRVICEPRHLMSAIEVDSAGLDRLQFRAIPPENIGPIEGPRT